IVYMSNELFFFSSRRRHTRSKRDWSSDVCSSDLIIRVSDTIDQANKLGQKVSVVLHYLYDDFSQVNEMVQSAQEKQEFGLKIIEAQEVERKRLSREIHDGPAQ